MKVLSLFDGISCGQIALNRSGITHEAYYASEIDKYAIKITQANYPGTIHLGDILQWRNWAVNWAGIGLVLAGSPCQGFSFIGKQLAFDDPRSRLFFVYVDILNFIRELNPGVKFLLENVMMKEDSRAIITGALGVKPVVINSSLVSAQNRKRLYWANWTFQQPENKNILLKDVIETSGIGCIKNMGVWKKKTDKSQCLDANYFKGVDNHGQRTMIFEPESAVYRKLTPTECEKLQTVPVNYSSLASPTQRYRCLGNGWTVDVVAHILKHLTTQTVDINRQSFV